MTAALAVLSRLRCLLVGHRYVDGTDPLACHDCHTRTVIHWTTEETS